MKIFLAEGIHEDGARRFEEAGYSVQRRKHALSDQELREILPEAHIVGIRSKTEIRADTLSLAKNLLGVGCFCIGTNQVDVESALSSGIPVFNAPFSNTRSVAELTMAEIVMLARRAVHKNSLLHSGKWEKSADGCFEVRNKTLGVIGYGHIGPQVGILAEAFGMRVFFYDIASKLPLGNAARLESMEELLRSVDFVSLHVPETPSTRGIIGAKQLALMKQGSYLLNLSRGSQVVIPALAEAVKSGHLAGAALDVFPVEPASNDEEFISELCGLPNVILTPHIGGSTNEAQKNIGIEVADTLIKFIETGSTAGAVNFPQVQPPVVGESHRLLHIHKNVPGVLKEVNSVVAKVGANIISQYLNTLGEVGYLIMDVDKDLSAVVRDEIRQLSTTIRVRLLY